jgi:tRNA pseudouridine38-40 synthase
MARTLKITLAYDGFDFHGWQVQPGLVTVQGLLSSALERVTGEYALPQGSGRTDAGVHALAQVASCAIESPIPAGNLVIALNDILPPAVRVLTIEEAAPDFHARAAATAKTYRYRIWRGAICPPFLSRYVYHHPYSLDEGAMAAAAAAVVGQHDFTSFAAVDPERGRGDEEISNLRTVVSSAWQRDGEEMVYTVGGNGFLHHMVRNLVGTFLLVGKGTLSPQDVGRILEAKKRSAAGPTAPAHGLYLVSVEY